MNKIPAQRRDSLTRHLPLCLSLFKFLQYWSALAVTYRAEMQSDASLNPILQFRAALHNLSK